jgi:hypothetical protein
MLSVKEPSSRLAPMLAKPSARPSCVDGTLRGTHSRRARQQGRYAGLETARLRTR